MAQQGSRGLFQVGGLQMNNSIVQITGSAAPTNGTSGTGAGVAGPGSTYLRTNGLLYVNINTKASPTWSVVAIAGALTLALPQDNVTAGSTQTQAGATALTGQVVRVGTVTTLGDGVKLPASVAGLEVTVVNDGANPMKVYGAGADTINSITNTVGVYQGTGTTAIYTCTAAGNWKVAGAAIEGVIPVALSVNGAIVPDCPQIYKITKGSALADTLAAPVAASDGQYIILVSETAFAHTLTATGLLNTGSAFVNVATFNAQTGASLTLLIRNLKYYVVAANGISFS